MRTANKIMRWVINLVFIFILGALVGYGIAFFTDSPMQSEETEIISDTSSAEQEASSQFEPNLIDQLTPAPDSVDYQLIENTITDLVNELRTKLGLATLRTNDTLRLAANIRAVEIEKSFSHTRPNGTDPFTVLEEEGIEYPYYIAGENLAMATFYRDDEYMARLLFNGWVESEDHYQTMINPEFKEIGVGVHYDGEILYATQFFGAQR